MEGTTGLETDRLHLHWQKRHKWRMSYAYFPSHTHTHLPLAARPGLVIRAELGESSAEVMEVIYLAIQHLQEALQLPLQVALPVFALLDVCLQRPHFVLQVLIVSFGRLTS